jgi:hypothetical protein
VRNVDVHRDGLEDLRTPGNHGRSGVAFPLPRVGHPGVGLEVGQDAEPLVRGEPGLGRAAAANRVDEIAGQAALVRVVATPVPAVVARSPEVGPGPQRALDGAHPRGDHVDDAVVAVQVDLHLAVGIQVVLPAARGDVVLQHAAAPNGEVNLARVVTCSVVPDLFHRSILLVEDRPLPRLRVVAACASRRGGPDVVVLHRHPVHHVVDQSAVELVEMVEAPAAEPRQPSAEHADPEVAGVLVYVEGRDHPPRQPVLFLPAADLPGPLVEAGQAVLRSDPHVGPLDLDREDVVVGQAVPGRELIPPRVHVGLRVARSPVLRRRGRRCGQHRRQPQPHRGPSHASRLVLHSVFRNSIRSLS